MAVTRSEYVWLEQGIKPVFDKALEGARKSEQFGPIEQIITRVPSNAASEKYGWLGDVPQVAEWIGDKKLAGLKDYDYTIRNKDYYTGFSVDRNEIDDDQVGIIKPRIDLLALTVASWPLELIISLITGGTTNLGYDGVAFFGNTHAVGDDGANNNDNLLTGTGYTAALLAADWATCRKTMASFRWDSGRYIRCVPDTIVCPTALETLFLQLKESTSDPSSSNSGVANPAGKQIKNVIALPELNDATDWYALCTSLPLKPFILQERKAPTPVMDETRVKQSRKIDFSCEMRGNAGYGLYQLALKVVNTGS